LHPEIYYTKKLMGNLMKRNKIVLYIDFHGHSCKKNGFFYGCNVKDKPMLTRELPTLLGEFSAHFNYGDCNFAMQASKKGTSRISAFNELGIVNSYTFETSFNGSDYKPNFAKEDYMKLGEELCSSLSVYYAKKYIKSVKIDEEWKEFIDQQWDFVFNKDRDKPGDQMEDNSAGSEDDFDDLLEPDESEQNVNLVELFKTAKNGTRPPRGTLRTQEREELKNLKKLSTVGDGQKDSGRMLEKRFIYKKLGRSKSDNFIMDGSFGEDAKASNNQTKLQGQDLELTAKKVEITKIEISINTKENKRINMIGNNPNSGYKRFTTVKSTTAVSTNNNNPASINSFRMGTPKGLQFDRKSTPPPINTELYPFSRDIGFTQNRETLQGNFNKISNTNKDILAMLDTKAQERTPVSVKRISNNTMVSLDQSGQPKSSRSPGKIGFGFGSERLNLTTNCESQDRNPVSIKRSSVNNVVVGVDARGERTSPISPQKNAFGKGERLSPPLGVKKNCSGAVGSNIGDRVVSPAGIGKLGMGSLNRSINIDAKPVLWELSVHKASDKNSSQNSLGNIEHG
jgi:hypothetical protein